MKNNLLSVCVDKCSDADEKVLTYNDMLELIVLNKIQRGDFDDLVEEVTGGNYAELEESVDESCEWFCSECDSRGFLMSKKLANAPENNNSMKFLCAGYTDCMDEAIRFLVEEENISPEHPVVRNLKAHLEHSKERILDAASEVICRSDVEEECHHSLRTEHANAAPVDGFLGDLLRAWNTG